MNDIMRGFDTKDERNDCMWSMYMSGLSPKNISKIPAIKIGLPGIYKVIRQYKSKTGINRKHFERKLEWSDELAYLIGLITSDGHIDKGYSSSPKYRIAFKVKDYELINNFKLLAEKHVTRKTININKDKSGLYRLMLSSKNFYNFLTEIGLTHDKTYTMDSISIPDEYFSAFLRGEIDGDGSWQTVDREWSSTGLHLRLRIFAKRKALLLNFKNKINELLNVNVGCIYKSKSKKGSCHGLQYCQPIAKKIRDFVYDDSEFYLTRKRNKAYSVQNVS